MPFNTAKQFILAYETQKPNSYLTFADSVLNRFISQNRTGMVRHYRDHIATVKKYKPDLVFSEIKPSWLESFEDWMRAGGMKQNSIATRMRDVRLTYRRAEDELDLNQKYPFKNYKIKTEEGKHKNISIENIRRIINYNYQSAAELTTINVFTLDLFLLGMNIKDLFYLKKEYLVGGRLKFLRGKTGKMGKKYNIKVEPEALKIIRYGAGRDHLLWFADNPIQSEKKHSRTYSYQYKDEQAFEKMLNRNLWKIQQALKIPGDKITTYSIRDSVATLMNDLGIDDRTISIALTHRKVENKTTAGYVFESDESYKAVDEANRRLIDYIVAKSG